MSRATDIPYGSPAPSGRPNLLFTGSPTDRERDQGSMRGLEFRRSPGRALVTGCAGFIGSHLSERLLAMDWEVVGVDAFTDFYDSRIKLANLTRLLQEPLFSLRQLDLSSDRLEGLVEDVQVVFHLAAQAGVRGSFGNSFDIYVRNNILATQRLLEVMAKRPGPRLVYASSSSVYGNAVTMPTPESADRHPVSPYGMTKVATEELAGVYSRVHGIPTTGLRYFTAYGPRQRPDMAFSRFIAGAITDRELVVMGDGEQGRDFTYVSDVVEATIAAADLLEPMARVFNVGGDATVTVNQIIGMIAQRLERPVRVVYGPRQKGDARHTSADLTAATEHLRFRPSVTVQQGLAKQIEWTLESARRPTEFLQLRGRPDSRRRFTPRPRHTLVPEAPARPVT